MSGELRLPPALGRDAHKGQAGRLFALVGSRRMPGAALLVARAAQRAGAGLVRVGCLDESVLQLLPPAVPEAIWTELGSDPGSLAGTLAERYEHAFVVGPGLGASDRSQRWSKAALVVAPGRPRVFDADGLSFASGAPERFRVSVGPTVLTPHAGEAGRLLGRPVPAEAGEAEEVDEAAREECARELALRSGAVVCLKGPATIVTDGERLFRAETGNPGLATAGTGDVLSGILGAYLARQAASREALDALACARAAVHVHGAAADLAAEALGRRALIASDVIDHLGAVQKGRAAS